MNRPKYNTLTSMLDLLFLIVMGFVALFVLSYLQIQPENKTAKVDSKAEFLITYTWPDGRSCDIDAWCQSPTGHLVFFKRREDGLLHLDRDDRGSVNDIVYTEEGPVEYKLNQEIISIRAITAGEYIFNVHFYAEHSYPVEPVPVTIKIEKLNPYKIILYKEITLNTVGEEKTVCRMELDNEGEVVKISYLFKPLTELEGADLP
jgi:hypothetical protein